MNTMLLFKSRKYFFSKKNLLFKARKIILTAAVSILFMSNVFSQSENCTGSFQADKPHGLWQCNYAGGQVQYKINYNEGIMEGSRKEYYENGQLKIDAAYSNNLLNGPLKEYYEGGTLKYEGSFSNGNPTGIHKEYDTSGQVLNENDFGS